MVRKDGRGVDQGIPQDASDCLRKMNDWKAVEELTGVLREFDPVDPVKYDFALFGIGVNEKF